MTKKVQLKMVPKDLLMVKSICGKSVDMKSPTSFDKNEKLVMSRKMPTHMKQNLWPDTDENRIFFA